MTVRRRRSVRVSTTVAREALADAVAQQERLEQIDARALEAPAAPSRRGRHRLGQPRQGRARPGRRLGAGRDGEADLGRRAVGQPAQRRRDVRVGRGERAVDGLLRRRAVERRVARAAQQLGRLLQEGGARRRPARRSRAGRRRAARPPPRRRRAPPPCAAGARPPRARVAAACAAARRRPRASARPPPCRSAARAARCGARRPAARAGERPAAPARRRRARPPARGRAGRSRRGAARRPRAPPRPRPAARSARRRRPVVERALDRGVVELGAAAHPRPPQVDGDLLAGRVEVDRPHARRRSLAGQQARRALRQRDRVQRHAGVRPVERRAARPRLAVDRAAGDDERRDVGDRVAHPPAAAGAAFEVRRPGRGRASRAGRASRRRTSRRSARARPAERRVGGRRARRRVGLRERPRPGRRGGPRARGGPRRSPPRGRRRAGQGRGAGGGARRGRYPCRLAADSLGHSRRRPDDLLERDAELEELRSACDERARTGRAGSWSSRARRGAARARSLAAAAGRAEAAGLRVLRARGSELERDLGFGAIRQLFETRGDAPRRRPSARSCSPARPRPPPGSWRRTRGAAPRRRRPTAGSRCRTRSTGWRRTCRWRGRCCSPWTTCTGSTRRPLRSLAYLARRIADLPHRARRRDAPRRAGHARPSCSTQLRAEPGAARIALRPLQPASVAAIVRAAIPDAGDDALLGVLRRPAPATRSTCASCCARSRPTDGARPRRAGARGGDPVGRRPRLAADRARRPGRGRRSRAAWRCSDDGGRLADAAALAGLAEDAAAAAASRMRRIEVARAARIPSPSCTRSCAGRSTTRCPSPSATPRTPPPPRGCGAPRRVAGGGRRPPGGGAARAGRPPSSPRCARPRARRWPAAAPEAAIRWLRRAHGGGRGGAVARGAAARARAGRALRPRPAGDRRTSRPALELADEPVLRARIALDLPRSSFPPGAGRRASGRRRERSTSSATALPELALEIEAFLACRAPSTRGWSTASTAIASGCGRSLQGEGWAAHALAVLLAANAAARGERADEVRPSSSASCATGRLLAERGAGGWATAHALMALVWTTPTTARWRSSTSSPWGGGRERSNGTMTALGYRGWSRRGRATCRGRGRAAAARSRSGFSRDAAVSPAACGS